jgi:hypothetical protein
MDDFFLIFFFERLSCCEYFSDAFLFPIHGLRCTLYALDRREARTVV